MNLALNNLQRLICHKSQTAKLKNIILEIKAQCTPFPFYLNLISSWLYNIPDTHTNNVATPFSDMSPMKIPMAIPSPVFYLHNARGYTSF